MLLTPGTSAFDESVQYIHFKQLEEADILVISKIDFRIETVGFALCSPSTTPPRPSDSLAPARSALAGLRLRRIPFAASQAAKVPHSVAEREANLRL